MRKTLPEKIESGRVLTGFYASRKENGPSGVFAIHGPCGTGLAIIASSGHDRDSEGWEHVSVSTQHRPPNWQEMCFVKNLFWTEDECVVQFHPPETCYVNNHPHCLHLWRHIALDFPMPPSILVGIKQEGELTLERARKLHLEMWER